MPKEFAVAVDGIAQGDGAAEAIVRARIAESALNLKVRRFDTGWVWEAVETKAGTWIDATTAVGQLVEQERRRKTVEWAKPHLDEYARTVYAMTFYYDSVPSGTAWTSMLEGWAGERDLGVRGATFGNWSDEERKERIKRYSEPAVDAWGSEVQLAFDDARRMATFVSVGPDKSKGTPDDLVVICVGQKVWSDLDDRLIWRYSRTFQLPAGLEPALAKYREERDTVA